METLWRRTVGEPIHGLDAASLTLGGQVRTWTPKKLKNKSCIGHVWSRVVFELPQAWANNHVCARFLCPN